MYEQFWEYIEQLFPCIEPYAKEGAKAAMVQFDNYRKPLLGDVLGGARYDSTDLQQGDIFSEIPFLYMDENGRYKQVLCKAQLLSNTCDASRDKRLVFAALQPLDDFGSNPGTIDAIKRNKTFSSFYLNDHKVANEYVDFELINTISREAFLLLMSSRRVHRIGRLTLVGYYMFLCKLTVFLMRAEDREVNAARVI